MTQDTLTATASQDGQEFAATDSLPSLYDVYGTPIRLGDPVKELKPDKTGVLQIGTVIRLHVERGYVQYTFETTVRCAPSGVLENLR